MLLNHPTLDGIAAGTVTQVFRCWRRPTVRAGGQLHTAVGLLAIDTVEAVTAEEITEADAHAAGHRSRGALLTELGRRPPGQLYRIRLRLVGPDPRVALRADDQLTATARAELTGRLDRLDASSRRGPWTRATLRLIAERPGDRASELAATLRVDTARLKTDIRKLKNLGLTESLPTGYRLAPRGATLLSLLEDAGDR